MKEKETAVKKSVRNDIFLILGLLAVAAAGLIYLFFFRSHGDTVKVTVDGELYGTYPLGQNMTEDIYTGESMEHLNRLVIQDGKAYMESADCPDGICVEHSKIFRDGESIVCLPHRVVITVVSENDKDAPDVVM